LKIEDFRFLIGDRPKDGWSEVRPEGKPSRRNLQSKIFNQKSSIPDLNARIPPKSEPFFPLGA
jgi:hypothetical protein